MREQGPILIHEHESLVSGRAYDGTEFKERHFKALAKHLSNNQGCPFYTLYYDGIKFNQYVGVIRIDDLTIEVLPKTDKHALDKRSWQDVLINMLTVSLQVEAKTTMQANIQIRKHSVLETYLHHFLDQIEILIHHGLIKKYRTSISNQNALKGKLLFHTHITKNIVHAERFFVAHQVYDQDNIYNAILQETLLRIESLNVSGELTKRATSYLLSFPECSPFNLSENLFARLQYDRKTDRYKTAIELARIILLNYHPDVRGGRNNVLAIMFDMNVLWENFIYASLKKELVKKNLSFIIKAQAKKYFWKPENGNRIGIRPDIVVHVNREKSVVIDTKWKNLGNLRPSDDDLKQMFVYHEYFNCQKVALAYPGDFPKVNGTYFTPEGGNGKKECSLIGIPVQKDIKVWQANIANEIANWIKAK